MAARSACKDAGGALDPDAVLAVREEAHGGGRGGKAEAASIPGGGDELSLAAVDDRRSMPARPGRRAAVKLMSRVSVRRSYITPA